MGCDVQLAQIGRSGVGNMWGMSGFPCRITRVSIFSSYICATAVNMHAHTQLVTSCTIHSAILAKMNYCKHP